MGNKKTRSKNDGVVFAIEGVHGIGKSTVISLLQTMFENFPNIRFFPERLTSVPPVPFGSKDLNVAFRSEVHYSQQMIKRNELVKRFLKNQRENIAILDRSPLSTLVYGKALGLSKIDYQLLEDTYKSIAWQNETIIYLTADPKTVMTRIIRRGSLDADRLKWNEEDMEYLRKIQQMYEVFFGELKSGTQKTPFRISTDERTPQDVVNDIIKVIERKAGVQINKVLRIPTNQSKLTSWFE
jgi:thymidylate kinase